MGLDILLKEKSLKLQIEGIVYRCLLVYIWFTIKNHNHRWVSMYQ